MDAQQLLEAAQAAYEAYLLERNGMRDGHKLKSWVDLTQEEIDAQVVAVQAVETYINGLA